MRDRGEALTLAIAERLRRIAAGLPIPLVFKASFDKANRTSVESYRGPGLEKGLAILRRVKEATGLPVTTDIHETHQAAAGRRGLRSAANPGVPGPADRPLGRGGRTGRAVHVKKGQFMAPWDMKHVVGKLEAFGCRHVLLGERGTFFGYGRLVNDMRSIPQMQALGAPGRLRRHPQRAGAGRAGRGHRRQPGDGRAAGPGRRCRGRRRAVLRNPSRARRRPERRAEHGPAGPVRPAAARLVAIRQTVEKLFVKVRADSSRRRWASSWRRL